MIIRLICWWLTSVRGATAVVIHAFGVKPIWCGRRFYNEQHLLLAVKEVETVANAFKGLCGPVRVIFHAELEGASALIRTKGKQ